MAKTSDVGIYQLESGLWEYRIVINRKDLKVDTTCRQDEAGNPFRTKKAAKEARELKLVELKTNPQPSKIKDVKLVDVYNKYMETGAKSKASTTIMKQKSMWDNHIEKNFGNKYLSEITLEELNNYLETLYLYGDGIDTYKGGYSYAYVEGFLKFLYLLFGCAYRDDLISTERYTKMFLDKGSHLSMPKKTQSDSLKEEEDARAYTMEEIAKIEAIFARGNCFTAFMLGFYLGVRISECFALRYSDIDWVESTITVRCQQGYEDEVFNLGPVKTLKSVRTIDIPEVLWQHLDEKYRQYMSVMESNPDAYRNTEVLLDRTQKGVVTKIVGGAFINRKENGELLTIHSMKYWRNVIKKETGIDFKYHGLRKTHATMMANLNTPALELMNRLGHKKYDTTLSYYVNSNLLAKEQLKLNINDIEHQMEKERQQLKSAVGSAEDDVKLQKFRETVAPILPEFDENNE